MIRTGFLSHTLLSVLLVFSAGSLTAQEAREAESRATVASGRIDTVMQDDGYIVVDGKRFVYRDSQVSITYKGRELRSSFLEQGLRISYTTSSDGSISTINLLGPVEVLEQFDSQ